MTFLPNNQPNSVFDPDARQPDPRGEGGRIIVMIVAIVVAILALVAIIAIVLRGTGGSTRAAEAADIVTPTASTAAPAVGPDSTTGSTTALGTSTFVIAPPAPVTVVIPPPVPTTALAVTVSSASPNYSGPCAGHASISFTSVVSVTRGPSDVEVAWQLDNGMTSPTQTIHFGGTALQQRTVTYATTSATTSHTGWAQAHAWINGGASVQSSELAWSVTCTEPNLTVTTPELSAVHDGQYYNEYATGMRPGETVSFTYYDPSLNQTHGLGTAVADNYGTATLVVYESLIPRTYVQYATGESSSGLGVSYLNVTYPPVLSLSASTVADGHSYTATAAHFAPGETVTFSWTGPTSGTITNVVANSLGVAAVTVTEGATPGSYTIHAVGNHSALSASASLTVVA